MTTKTTQIRQFHHQSTGGMIFRIIRFPLLVITATLARLFVSCFFCCFCYDLEIDSFGDVLFENNITVIYRAKRLGIYRLDIDEKDLYRHFRLRSVKYVSLVVLYCTRARAARALSAK